MTAPELSEQIVADVVAMHPAAAAVFVSYNMDCVGCALARFETVREAALSQGVDPGRLAASLARAIRGTKRKRT